MPGSTTQVRFSTSSERRRFRCLEKSTTIPSLTVWPHCEVPPPRGVTIRPSSLAMAKRPQRLVHGPGNHHAQGQNLVERGIGRVAAAVEGVEENSPVISRARRAASRAVFRRIL